MHGLLQEGRDGKPAWFSEIAKRWFPFAKESPVTDKREVQVTLFPVSRPDDKGSHSDEGSLEPVMVSVLLISPGFSS